MACEKQRSPPAARRAAESRKEAPKKSPLCGAKRRSAPCRGARRPNGVATQSRLRSSPAGSGAASTARQARLEAPQQRKPEPLSEDANRALALTLKNEKTKKRKNEKRKNEKRSKKKPQLRVAVFLRAFGTAKVKPEAKEGSGIYQALPKVKENIIPNFGMSKEVCVTKNVPENERRDARSVTHCILHGVKMQ